MRATTSWIAVLVVAAGLAGLAQWRVAAAAAEAERTTKTEAPAQARRADDARKRQIATVYLRGDAMGQRLNYVPGVSNMPSVQGELVSIDAEWVILTVGGKRQRMVARSAILMIESETP